jgi:hypothetical protein
MNPSSSGFGEFDCRENPFDFYLVLDRWPSSQTRQAPQTHSRTSPRMQTRIVLSSIIILNHMPPRLPPSPLPSEQLVHLRHLNNITSNSYHRSTSPPSPKLSNKTVR